MPPPVGPLTLYIPVIYTQEDAPKYNRKSPPSSNAEEAEPLPPVSLQEETPLDRAVGCTNTNVGTTTTMAETRRMKMWKRLRVVSGCTGGASHMSRSFFSVIGSLVPSVCCIQEAENAVARLPRTRRA